MKKHCDMCGAPIDKSIGFCPRCDQQRKIFTDQQRAVYHAAAKTVAEKKQMKDSGKKKKHLLTRLCLWIAICVLLSTVVTVSLVCLDVVDIPVVDDAVRKVELLFHRKHDWIDATCTAPRTCKECGETEGPALDHTWKSATCQEQEVCTRCGMIGQSAKGHDWTNATCTAPRTCEECGETEGTALGHRWMEATCTAPRTCKECEETEGTALDHRWIDATYETPKTCSVCGITEGEVLVKSWTYINELEYIHNFGKVWILCTEKLGAAVNSDITDKNAYVDFNTPAYVTGPVEDYLRNEYTYGLCVDGLDYSEYSISYYLGGKYSTFSGYVSMTPDVSTHSAATKGKYFEVYGDGVLLGRSPTMTSNLPAQTFSIDVTGVEVLTIKYPKTAGPSRMAMIFDGKLS